MAEDHTGADTAQNQGAGTAEDTRDNGDVTTTETGLTAGVEPKDGAHDQNGDGGQDQDPQKDGDGTDGDGEGDKGSTDFEVKLPEGVQVSEEQIGEFKEMVAGFKGKSEAEIAQQLVDYQTKLLEQQAEQVTNFWAEQDKAWNEAAAKDPIIQQHERDAIRLIQEEGDAELIEALNTSRMGNNPALRRFVAKTAVRIANLEQFIRQRIGEDPYAGDGTGSTGPKEPKSDGEILYPSMTGNG